MFDKVMLNLFHDTRLDQCQLNSLDHRCRGALILKSNEFETEKSNTDQQFMLPDHEEESLVSRDGGRNGDGSWKAHGLRFGRSAVPSGENGVTGGDVREVPINRLDVANAS